MSELNQLSKKQLKLAYAIKSWAERNNKRNKKGNLLKLNRRSANLQKSMVELIMQAREQGFPFYKDFVLMEDE